MRKVLLVVAALIGLGVAALAGYGGFRLVPGETEQPDAWSATECRRARLDLAAWRSAKTCGEDPCFLQQAAIDIFCDPSAFDERWTPDECERTRLLAAMHELPGGACSTDAQPCIDLAIAINDRCD